MFLSSPVFTFLFTVGDSASDDHDASTQRAAAGQKSSVWYVSLFWESAENFQRLECNDAHMNKISGFILIVLYPITTIPTVIQDIIISEMIVFVISSVGGNALQVTRVTK